MFRSILNLLVLIPAAILCTAANTARAEKDDLLVGRSALNQLKIGGFNTAEEVIGLPCVSGILQGWGGDEPGFDHVEAPDTGADLHPLDAGAQVRIVCMAIDPALRVISPSFTIIDAPGESLLLGGSALHIHLTWHINSGDPLFVSTQTDWYATFRLIDTGSTGLADSAPFTLHFRNGDCLAGDANDDGMIDGRDVQAFTAIMLDPPAATLRQQCLADCNRDCSVAPADIGSFVNLLIQG